MLEEFFGIVYRLRVISQKLGLVPRSVPYLWVAPMEGQDF